MQDLFFLCSYTNLQVTESKKKNSASKDYSTFRYHVHYNVEVKRERQSTIEEKRQIKEDKHT
jgi:hypothetical protein